MWCGVSKFLRYQGSRDEGLFSWGSKAQGVEGQRAPWVTADPKVSRLQEPKGSFSNVNGQGLELPIITVPRGMKVFLGLQGPGIKEIKGS